MANSFNKNSIGLVLSGGGARGIAHLGVIKALEEHGLRFSAVSGSSAGALAGALYCRGYSPEEICDFIVSTNFLTTFRPSFNWRSLLDIRHASAELSKYFPIDNFSDLKIPLYVTTTEILKGKVKVFKKGELIKPILASCSIPVVFDPVVIGKHTLVDGGVMDNLPYKPLKKVCDHVVAVHCNPIDKDYELGNWRDLMERSMMLTITQNVHSHKRSCDVFLEPAGLSRYKVFDFKKAPEIYQLGYDYTKEAISKGVLDGLNRKK